MCLKIARKITTLHLPLLMHFSELKDSNEIILKRVIMRNISGEVIVSLRLGEVLVSLKYWVGIFTHREVWPCVL